VLVWAGAPVPAFHPTRQEVREGVEELTRGTRIRCEADPRERPFHCRHEKTVIVDGEVEFVGGIDMTVVTDDAELARETRLRLWAEHLEVDLDAIAGDDPHTVVDVRWREIAFGQLERRDAGAPPTHRLG
jgi:Phospholipase D Active site motif